MSVHSATLNVMISACRKAARGLVRDFGEVENLQVSIKGAGDFVSAADIKAEKTLREELMNARPAYGWLGEETEPLVGKDPTRRWIVDPLDGTTNFLHGLPHWSISVALEHRGEIVAGIVHDPIKDEMFIAEKGNGAWMNDRRMRVSARRTLEESLFATGVPFGNKDTLPTMLRELARLMPRTAGIRRFGSAALDLTYVAAGRYDGFWEREIKPWDMAAGIVIAREAGAIVTDLEGGPDMLTRGDVIAANADLVEKLRAHLGD
ncbi:MAG: inositol monophosphatase [Neomegalonema sp.]|nr:inositol monophosphatase [Neomegalonema sp.]